jgi:hypothetical protein
MSRGKLVRARYVKIPMKRRIRILVRGEAQPICWGEVKSIFI